VTEEPHIQGEPAELWSLTATGPVFGEVQGVQPFWTHARNVCQGHGERPCVLHNPTDHHMREWPTLWRADRALMERTCSHGVGHPDPDDLWWHEQNERGWQAVHGCDGCCANPTA